MVIEVYLQSPFFIRYSVVRGVLKERGLLYSRYSHRYLSQNSLLAAWKCAPW